jgi:hypothetical protein
MARAEICSRLPLHDYSDRLLSRVHLVIGEIVIPGRYGALQRAHELLVLARRIHPRHSVTKPGVA